MRKYRDAYPKHGGRRESIEEIEAYIAKETGCTPVKGFSEIIEIGGAIEGGERISGFMEDNDHHEWLFRIDSKKALRWKTHVVPAGNLDKIAFAFSIGFGNGSPLPQPTGSFDIYCNDHFAVSIRVVRHSQLWQSGECSLAFTANRLEAAPSFCSLTLSSIITSESFATFGPALLTVPASWVTAGSPAVIRIEGKAEESSTRWFQLRGDQVAVSGDIYRAVELLARRRAPTAEGYNVYFGDIHTHSGQVLEENKNKGCGMRSREQCYQYARGPGGLDFYSLTDHEWQVDPGKITEYFALADEHTENGRFACIPGYEFTNLLYGHRNVYFRDSSGTIFNSTQPWGPLTRDPDKVAAPQDLWTALDDAGTEAITVPHHPSTSSHPCSWDFFSPKYDRLVEVYSSWGSSEYYGDYPRGVADRFRTQTVRDGLNRGYRMGMIASSDGHDGHPGNAQSSLNKHHHVFHHLGSGRAAVLAPELTQSAMFDALHDRRCYATTGSPIVLSFSLNGSIMGSEIPLLPSGKPPRISVACRGTNGIDHIRIIKNGKNVETVFCHGEFDFDLEWEDPEKTENTPSYYYVRAVQIDKESAWSSPIWVGGQG